MPHLLFRTRSQSDHIPSVCPWQLYFYYLKIIKQEKKLLYIADGKGYLLETFHALITVFSNCEKMGKMLAVIQQVLLILHSDVNCFLNKTSD